MYIKYYISNNKQRLGQVGFSWFFASSTSFRAFFQSPRHKLIAYPLTGRRELDEDLWIAPLGQRNDDHSKVSCLNTEMGGTFMSTTHMFHDCYLIFQSVPIIIDVYHHEYRRWYELCFSCRPSFQDVER